MVALMGPSGAGKTTLLNRMVGRSGGSMQGTISYNSQQLSKVRASIGYVTQEKVFLLGFRHGCCGFIILGDNRPGRVNVQWFFVAVCFLVDSQEDIMYETLTPRENLTFAAAFILPKLPKESRGKEVGADWLPTCHGFT